MRPPLIAWLIADVAEEVACQARGPCQIRPMPTAKAQRRGVKKEAIRLVRDLPASSSWDDLMYRIYVRQKIEAGLADFQAGRVHSHATIRKEFALP